MPRYIDAEALRQDLERQIRMLHTLSDHVIKENDPYIVRHEAMRQQTINQWCDGFFKYLDTRPTADVEPVRHGRWKDGNCSVCSVPAVTMRQADGVELRVETPRCPNCGAKMDGEGA